DFFLLRQRLQDERKRKESQDSMESVRGEGCWPGQAEGVVCWLGDEPKGKRPDVTDRPVEIRAFLAEVERAASDLDRWSERQDTIEGRVLCQEYREALTDGAWQRRACLLIDSEAITADTAAVLAAEQVRSIMERSPELRFRAEHVATVARLIARRLAPPALPADAVLAAPALSPLDLLSLQHPALILGGEPQVRGDVPLVWGVTGLGPHWDGHRVAINGTQVVFDAPVIRVGVESPTTATTEEEAPLPAEHIADETLPYAEYRRAVCNTARRMQTDGLVKLTSGNVSCRIPGTDLFAITPSGMDYESLEPADVCVLDLSGKVVAGSRRPSSETPMHALTYRRRPDVGGVVHTHSIYASAFACLGREMPVISTELAMLVGGTIPCAPYARSGTEEFGVAAVDTLGADALAVLFQNHGVMAVGRTLKEAYAVAVGLEEAAMIYYLASQMGSPVIIPAEERERMFREFRTSYGQRQAAGSEGSTVLSGAEKPGLAPTPADAPGPRRIRTHRAPSGREG
ncbi:MAG: class II aldolase/adducin family protein, partial [Mycobacterium leprae]